MTKKAKIIPIRKPMTPNPSVREKLTQAELEHVKKRARDALYKYGTHFVTCPAFKDTEADCTCSLYTVINSFH